MPNHVTNKIEFDKEHKIEINHLLDKNGNFDFNTLIPQPLSIYHGDLGQEDNNDFKNNTWYEWCIKNWGTKWGAYQTKIGSNENISFIQFGTAWSVPYPIIIAFANKYQIPFTYKYCCEGPEFWGIENWVFDQGRLATDNDYPRAYRKSKLFNHEEDKKALCIELLGYDPDIET